MTTVQDTYPDSEPDARDLLADKLAAPHTFHLPLGQPGPIRLGTQLPAGYQTLRRKKRKRQEVGEEDDDENVPALDDDGNAHLTADGTTTADSTSRGTTPQSASAPRSRSRSRPSAPPHLGEFTASHLLQLRTAGLAPGTPIPPRPFPDAAHPPIRTDGWLSSARTQIAQFAPPLHEPRHVGAEAGRSGEDVRDQALAVVNAIALACLRKGEYGRAERAWGLLVRAMPWGTHVRDFGRWGIAAELILRRGEGHGGAAADNAAAEQGAAPPTIPDANLSAARDFYERLIVRHPPQRNLSRAARARQANFYPALFGVWLWQIAQRRRLGLASVGRAVAAGEMDGKQALDAARGARRGEVREAREVVARFDMALETPPFDEDVALLRLRGMVAAWAADLLVPLEIRGDGSVGPVGLEEGEGDDEDVDEDERARKLAALVPEADREEYEEHLDWEKRMRQRVLEKESDGLVGGDAADAMIIDSSEPESSEEEEEPEQQVEKKMDSDDESSAENGSEESSAESSSEAKSSAQDSSAKSSAEQSSDEAFSDDGSSRPP